MLILGLGGSGHDFSACICEDGHITYYIEDERISRCKHSFIMDTHSTLKSMASVFYLLEYNNLEFDDFDFIVKNDLLHSSFYDSFLYEDRILTINHHLAHAASSYYLSGFDDAAIIVLDGAGSKLNDDQTETISFWSGKEYSITLQYKNVGLPVPLDVYYDYSIPYTNSIGGFYSIVTRLLGFSLFDEGKVMGLSAYGCDRYLSAIRKLVFLGDHGSFLFSKESVASLIELSDSIITFQDKADFAFAAQAIIEEAFLHSATYARSISTSDNLCLSGGCALNSVANYKLYASGLFKELFIPPATNDAGTSIGAALYAFHNYTL